LTITSKTPRICAIDYGTSRIGIAKTDPLGLFPQPVGTFNQENALKVLADIDRTDGISMLVIGYPKSQDGSLNRMTTIVDRFCEELHKQFPHIPQTLLDEYGSSAKARTTLVASGLSRKKRAEKGRIDSAAACIILQRHLETNV